MTNLENIRFVTSNFTQLKGLQLSIICLLLIGTALWSDKNQGDLSFPILMMILAAVLWVVVGRYYRHKFGKVNKKQEAIRLEIIASIIFILIGLGAFVLDTTGSFPISFLGIIFSIAILVDYLRISLKWRNSYFKFLSWFSIALLFVSLLPLFGVQFFWKSLGLQNHITGVMILVGFLGLIYGLLSHYFLMKAIPDEEGEI